MPKPYPSQLADRFIVRLPDGLRDHVRDQSALNHRTMNAEVVFQLQKAYGVPVATLDPDFAVKNEAQRHITDAANRAGTIAMWKRRAAPTPEPAPKAQIGPPVTLKELADRVKMDRSACRQYVLRIGYKPTKMRTASSGYQLALTLTQAEAREIQTMRASEGYCDAP